MVKSRPFMLKFTLSTVLFSFTIGCVGASPTIHSLQGEFSERMRATERRRLVGVLVDILVACVRYCHISLSNIVHTIKVLFKISVDNIGDRLQWDIS